LRSRGIHHTRLEGISFTFSLAGSISSPKEGTLDHTGGIKTLCLGNNGRPNAGLVKTRGKDGNAQIVAQCSGSMDGAEDEVDVGWAFSLMMAAAG
jgi:hypothetical protein